METSEIPLLFKPGFKERLWKLLDRIGVKEYGRKSLLAAWAELSPTAIGNILKEDRPPNSRINFDALMDRLLSAIEQHNPGSQVSRHELKNYLLIGTASPLTTKSKPKAETKETLYESLDLSTQGRLHVALSEAGKSLKINVFRELDKNALIALLDKAAQLNKKLDIEIDTAEMHELLKALVRTALSKT